MSDLKDIWPFDPNEDNAGKLSEDKLLAYLEGRLPIGEQHAIEQWLAAEGMESDAIEGLQGQHTDETRDAVKKLNYELQKKLATTKRPRKRPIKDNPWALLAVIIILLLAIVAYLVIYMMLRK